MFECQHFQILNIKTYCFFMETIRVVHVIVHSTYVIESIVEKLKR